jgi:hypothetical protein
MNDGNAKPWSEDRPRRDALVLGLIHQATETAPTEAEAASALLRSAATVLACDFGEAAACDLLLVALLETKASLHRRRHAH